MLTNVLLGDYPDVFKAGSAFMGVPFHCFYTGTVDGWNNTCSNEAVNSAGLGFHVTPHGLRHAHASWLLAGGADIQVVKERLGHGSITTTARYLGTLPGADDAALNALDAVRGQRELVSASANGHSSPQCRRRATRTRRSEN